MSKHKLALAKAIVVRQKGAGVEYTRVNEREYQRNLWRTVWRHPISVMTLGFSYRSVGDVNDWGTPFLVTKKRFKVVMCQPIRSAHGERYVEPFAVLPEDLIYDEK